MKIKTGGMGAHGERVETAVVTGASGGIGLALARLFARDGFAVVLVARDSPRLADAAISVEQSSPGSRVSTIACDLAAPGAAAALFERLDASQVRPAVFVNNAGFGLRGRFAPTSLRDEIEMIQVNVTTLTALTKLALTRMLAEGGGRILNVASTAAFQPGPFMAVYYATKAYVLSLSEALAEEMRGTSVTVTTLCPGPTATGFEARSGMSGSKVFHSYVMSAERVAQAGYDGLMRGQRLVIPGLRNKVLTVSLRIAPRAAVLRLVGWLQK